MPPSQNKITQFWQELKRRNVTRVVAVYIAVAFMVLELVDMISEPFRFPEGSLKVAFFILLAGLVIAVIVSWIFDLTPKGVEKTKPKSELQESDKVSTPNSWRIATYVSVVIIIGLIVFNIIGYKEISQSLSLYGKSIAVLPFINDSPDEENEYFINGTMEDILDNLCKIKDLRVVSRTSVEQYRNERKSVSEIADEMNVSYILEGSCQKHGDKIKLTVQLIDAINDKHLWSKPYHREIGIEDYFDLQSEIAQLIANEIEAIISPFELDLIEKVPTSNLTAYEFYQKGKEEEWKYKQRHDLNTLLRAEELYNIALEYDSTFALAYTGLAWIYELKFMNSSHTSKHLADSTLKYINLALQYDNQLSEAYSIRGRYNYETGMTEEAVNDYENALKYNPNNWLVYTSMGWMYFVSNRVKSFESYHKAALLHRGSELPSITRSLAYMYNDAGYSAKSNNYLNEALKLDNDSFLYYRTLARYEEVRGEFENAARHYEIAMKIDSTDVNILNIAGQMFLFSGQYKNSLFYFEKWLNQKNNSDNQHLNTMHRVGLAYFQNGNTKKADSCFNILLDYCLALIDSDNEMSEILWVYYDLAGVYAFRGEKNKAYESLNNFNQKQTIPLFLVSTIKNDPLFDSIRNEDRFQKIVGEIEAKHFAENEKVRKWLEENDML